MRSTSTSRVPVGILLGLLAAAVVLAGCTSGLPGAETTLRLALNQTEEHPSYLALADFDRRLSEATGGEWRVDVYPNETLGAQQEALQLVSDGIVDLAIVSGTQLENLDRDFLVFNLPAVFSSIDHQLDVIHDPAIVGELYASLEPRSSLTVLGGFTQGSRSIYLDEPITTPADLAGKKLRVQESELHLAMARAMGASPTPMAFGELYTGLQSGVVDAAENNEVSSWTQRHYEVAPHFSFTNHLIGLDYLIINSDRLAELPADVRAAFDAEWERTHRYHAELWREATAEAIANAEAGGASFHEVDTDAFDAVLAPLADQYAENEHQRRILAAVRAADPNR